MQFDIINGHAWPFDETMREYMLAVETALGINPLPLLRRVVPVHQPLKNYRRRIEEESTER